MIKVLHVISDSNIGGAGKYLLTCLKNCDKSKFDMSVAIPSGSLLAKEIKSLGYNIHEINGMAEKSLSLTAILSLIKLFNDQKPDIVHAHASFSARIAARLSKTKKIIYTRHSVFQPKRFLTKGIGKFINGIIGNFLADGIIAVAEAAKKNLTDTGIPEKKITVIYNGVDEVTPADEKQAAGFKDKYGLNNCRIVAIIARLNLVKGHEYFIEAAKVVSSCYDGVKFVIAGTGDRDSALKQYSKALDIDDNVIFTGFLNNTALLESVMDIQVNASFGTEAASLSLLEGMSLGKPAVVSSFGGNPELIKDSINGFVVPEKNSKELAEKILLLLNNKELSDKMSQNSRRIYEQTFTSRHMTHNTEKFYLKVMGCSNE